MRRLTLLAILPALLCLAAGGTPLLPTAGWSLFDPDDDWTWSAPNANTVLMTESITSSAVHPGWVLSDAFLPATVTVEFDLSVASGTGDDDLIGFAFGWIDGEHSYLLDWKRATQSFNWGQPVTINDDVAEVGMKIKRIDGGYTWDGLWGGTDGMGVSTVAGPAGAGWTAGTVYHFELELSPGKIVVTRDDVVLFDVVDPLFAGGVGKVGSYGFSQNKVTLANVCVSDFAWTDLGLGKEGVAGVPSLLGLGPLTGGSANLLGLSDVAPASTATLVVGIQPLYAPFKGGTMVPKPFLQVPLPTGAGEVVLPFTWPNGVPAGTSLYFQAWTQDGAASFGLSASNGLLGVSS